MNKGTDLDQVTRRLVVEPREDEDDTSEHDVNGSWYDPGVGGSL